jgi:hypothetical protein
MSPQRKLTMFAVALSGLVGSALLVTGEEAKANHNIYFQAKNMFLFAPPNDLVAGAATLVRTDKGISFKISTSGLEPGANTVWIVIFNKPQNCAGGPGHCAPSDINNPDVKASIVYGAGAIVGDDGIANFQGSLQEGSPPAGIQVNVPAGTFNGLKNALKADIHLVVRQHGAVSDTGGAVTQLSTFESPASCVNPGECANVQFALFDAVE